MRKTDKRGNRAVYCVIMGDIVKSREMEPEARERVMRAANEMFERINTDYYDGILAPLGVVRGDGFEGILLAKRDAPKIVQEIIRGFYRAEQTVVRICISLGELAVVGTDRNESDGPAFHRAQGRLTAMKEGQSNHWLQVAVEADDPVAQPLLDAQFDLLAALTEGWTAKQRQLAWEMEEKNDHQGVAAKALGMAPSAASRQLKAMRYEAYCRAWKGLKSYLDRTDKALVEGASTCEVPYTTYYNVAVEADGRREHETAVGYMEKARDLAETQVKEASPVLIRIYQWLANLYVHLGDAAMAESVMEKCMALQSAMPKTGMMYAQSLYIYGQMCRLQGQTQEAKDCLDRARASVRDGHPFLSFVYNEYAIACYIASEHEEAIAKYDLSLAIDKANNEDDTADYAVSLWNKALLLQRLNRDSEALRCAEEALAIFLDHFPANHPSVVNTKILIEEIKKAKEAAKS